MKVIDTNSLLKYIILTQIPGFGPISQNRLLDICGGISNCFTLDYNDISALDETCPKTTSRLGKKRILSFISSRDDRSVVDVSAIILDHCEQAGVSPITRDTKVYPDRFRGISEMPVLIYVKGNLRLNEYKKTTGIIGARRCSRIGKEKAIFETGQSVACGEAVISGMAKGVDSYAHTAALKNDGYTAAVLGNGPDICYPKEHMPLYEMIIERGCIISEYPPGTKPRNYRFPMRNRLIAALSDRLIVIDTGQNSGTKSTILSCEKYGRKIKYV